MKPIYEEWNDQDYQDFYSGLYDKPWDTINWDWYAISYNGTGEEVITHATRIDGDMGDGCRRTPRRHVPY